MHTKDLVEKQGYAVIYGDTDSIMINTGLEDLEQVKKLGLELKRMVNKCHKRLELDIDGVYKRLLLLKKKKYAGLAVDLNDSCKVKREMKGLDIVRRDWSVLAKDIGKVITLVTEAKKENKGCDKGDPQERPNFVIYCWNKPQPHAAVARRLNASGKFHFHRGDTVSYIICERFVNIIEDTLYYLAHQIHPVVCRLCEPIEETDAVQIAEALGWSFV
uniref:DNA-directed DNA polymerase n=1 Tax=Parascaris equorum TaxID=6256 RepID=A0A914SH34_PAREQ